MYRVLKANRFIVLLMAVFPAMALMWPYGKTQPQSPGEVKIIVLDAGHGGKDPGARYAGVNEKDIALSIVLKLGKKLKDSLPGVKVYYTRMDDTFVELAERGAIANRKKADLFISVHCNANDKTAVYGTETYVMGLHKSETNLEVAKRENESILLEDNYETGYEGFDPRSPEAHIIFSFYQNAFMDQSLILADKIERRFASRPVNNTSRGVKQAGFLVLWKAAMPAVLVEAGFISNAAERKYLAGDAGQSEVASKLFMAIKDYQSELDN